MSLLPLPRRLLAAALLLLATVLVRTVAAQDAPTTAATGAPSRLVEVSGRVEVMDAAGVWRPARTGEDLSVGTRVRTREGSRATVQFSDRSVLRLAPSSLVILQAPKAAPARRRFGLDLGRLLFLDREAPSDIEFETPVASGAIRGTEFVLSAAPDTTSLALLDGAVELRQDDTLLEVSSGELAELARGATPRKSRILFAHQVVQWALHYPQVIVPGDLALSPAEQAEYAPALAAWERGSAQRAYDLLPTGRAERSASAVVFETAVRISVGETDTQGVLERLDRSLPVVRALEELLAAVRGDPPQGDPAPTIASGWLSRSYRLQGQTRLEEALAAAQEATRLAPGFGPGWIRQAELEHAFERRRAALAALERGQSLSPDSAAGQALQGWVELAADRPVQALEAFDRAVAVDSGFGWAWMGRGVALGRRGEREAARRALQVAAALEPTRSEFRSYLGKAWAEAGDAERAGEELRLARVLDPADPTPWLYSALEQFQEHRPNEAVRDLERSIALNGNRAVFRSQLLLDRDRSSRNADLAVLFQSVGLEVPAYQLGARAVQEDFGNSSAHLLLARSLQDREDPLRANLRFETPRQNALLLANLLAPPGGGNLSQQLSQQDHLRHFGPRPFNLSSVTEYRSSGDWEQLATGFGTVGGLSYALDVQYRSVNGPHENADVERRDVSLQVKQRVGPDDELYLQVGFAKGESGDPFAHADPADTDPDLRTEARQEPRVHAGWHHHWAPGHHSLLLASWLRDSLRLEDGARPVPFVRQSGGVITSIDTDRALFDLEQDSDYDLRSIEYLHMWESIEHGLVAGARYQAGEVETATTLAGPLPPPFSEQTVDSPLERVDVQAEYHWRPVTSLRLTAGVAYQQLEYPWNADLPPVSDATERRDLIAPRLGATWSPGPRTHLRAVHAESLGGLYFDDSLRLAPAQLAGFITAPRSVVPESVVGLVPGTRFTTTGFGVDQSFTNGVYVGAEVQWVRSDGERGVGAASNSLPLPLPDLPTELRETLDTDERSVGAYVAWLPEREWSFGLRYRYTHTELESRFPTVPDAAAGLDDLERDLTSALHRVRFSVRYQRPDGWFAEWHTAWYGQWQEGGEDGNTDEDVWQQHVFGGYRFARRRAEIRLGILNLLDTDHRLQPLTLDEAPPRDRTFTATLRLNF